MISQTTINKIYETARVEEVIGDFVALKRAGSNLKGLSPFSDERSPSFMVSPAKQIWKDFSSGKGGNAIAFVMEHEHFSYPEALRYLAKKYNIEIEEEGSSEEADKQRNERESLYLVSEFAKDYFHKTIFQSEDGKAIGMSYFKERGFTLETIKKFGLGYSPDVWDAFTKEALGKGYKLEYLEKTGLTIVKEDKVFDRFKGRVMFPIHSMSGRVLGFGGRILTADKKAAKYVNSPESEIYYKSKVLYGIYQAKNAIHKLDSCYLVEGYTDVVQLHQAGIENVVASSGTALTPDQIRLISRLTKNITVLYDGDAAGLRASLRGIDLILEQDMNVRVCTFPEGEDPDSFARKTPLEDLKLYLEGNARDFIQFKASLLVEETQNDPIKKASIIREMIESIAKISDHIKQELYIRECSRIMDISEEVLFNTLAQISATAFKKESSTDVKSTPELVKVSSQEVAVPKVNVVTLLEKDLLSILWLYGHETIEFQNYYSSFNESGQEVEHVENVVCTVFEKIFLNLQEDEIALANPLFNDIYKELVAQYQLNKDFDKVKFLQSMDPQKANVITDLLMNDEKYSLHGWLDKKQVFVKEKSDLEIVKRLVVDTITALREYLINKVVLELMGQIKEPVEGLSPDNLLSDINDYNRLKVMITRKIGRMRSIYY